jgi:hypothetical protein
MFLTFLGGSDKDMSAAHIFSGAGAKSENYPRGLKEEKSI